MFRFGRPVLVTAVVATGLAVIVPAASAGVRERVVERVQSVTEEAREFWAQRGVTGCPGGFSIEVFDDPSGPVMQGGFCRIRVNLFWQPPHPWGASAQETCVLGFHEVKHALPGGTAGGVDGLGHTEDGLMAPTPDVVPRECVRWARQHRVRAVRRRAESHPLKGVWR